MTIPVTPNQSIPAYPSFNVGTLKSAALETRHLQQFCGPFQKLSLPPYLYIIINKQELAHVAPCEFKTLREELLRHLHLQPSAKIIQVIGDSALFSTAGTRQAADQLEAFFNTHQDAAILYGFTGHREGSAQDVNELVSQWIAKEPEERSSRVCANVVDKHTVEAIESWPGITTSPHVKYFALVRGGALFGDDAPLSDFLTQRAFCLEGGAQSFCQIVNFLDKDVEIQGIFGIRNEADRIYLSACEFLQVLKNAVKQNEKIEATEIEKLKEAYLENHHLFNPARPDAGTKQKLFDSAWQLFVEKELWKKLRNLVKIKTVSKGPTVLGSNLVHNLTA